MAGMLCRGRRRLLGAAAGASLLATLRAGAAAAADPAPLPAGLDLLQRPAPATRRGARRLLLDVCTGGPGLVCVGEAGLLLGSTDGGRHWQQLPSPTSVMLTAVAFADARNGWAVGHDGVVLASQDGGARWRRCFDGHQANAAMLASAQARQAAARDQAQRERAADALAAAEQALRAGPSRPLLALAVADPQRAWVAGAFGQLFATADGGQHWQDLGDRLDNPEGLHLNGLMLDAADGRDGLFIAAEAGVVFRSRDGGQRWQRSETGYSGHLYGVVRAADALLAHGFNGHLFRSTDDGRSWAAVPLPLRRSLVAARQRAGVLLLLAEDGQLLASRDGGASFALLPERLPARRHTGLLWTGPGSLVAVGAGGVSLHGLPASLR